MTRNTPIRHKLTTHNAESAPPPAGHYSHAVIHGDVAYLSGQLPIDPTTGKPVDGSIESQARQVLANVEAVLSSIGSGLHAVLRTTVYVCGIGHWPAVNGVYAEFFGEHRPARTVVPVAELHFGALVEMDVIAVCSGGTES